MTPSRICLSYLGSSSLAARSGALLMEHSNAPAPWSSVFKEAEKAHAKAKTSLLQQKSERKKIGKICKISCEKLVFSPQILYII